MLTVKFLKFSSFVFYGLPLCLYFQPHIFKTAARALENLRRDDQNESIIVSGESGAGKVIYSYSDIFLNAS